MGSKPKWISPSVAMDMVYDDPAGPSEDFAFALLRPKAKNRLNLVADLARAKLQPREPAKTEQASGCSWPITAYAHRLVLAPGVPDVSNLRDFFTRYDAERHPRLNPLAGVLTMRFGRSEMLHDAMREVSTYVQMILSQKRGLSSLLVQHVPSHELSKRAPHIHVLVLSRVHLPPAWGEIHPTFLADEVEMHEAFRDEWRLFRETWRKAAMS